MSAGSALGSTALLAVMLGPTGSQLAFGEPRLKPCLAIRGINPQNSYADRHRSLASIRRNVSLRICGACASARRRSRRRTKACAYLRRQLGLECSRRLMEIHDSKCSATWI